ncbi:type VII secretion protein EccCa [Streptomyces sp. AF1A]|uniref:type VII secretion protein EccCa n=1 Tax=Streptomyces sp. AF1A TaxID=3394350 RepID=UPI0039BCA445
MPEPPSGEWQIEPPPELPETVGSTRTVLGCFASVCSLGALVLLMLPGSEAAGRWTALASGLVAGALLGDLLSHVRGRGRDRQERLGALRRDYLRYLRSLDHLLHEESAVQRRYRLWSHPAPDTLWAVAMSDRLWERRPSDPDFAHVRLGVGPQNRMRPLIAPETRPVEELDPVSADGLRRLLRTHRSVPDLPLAAALRSYSRVVLDGHPEAVRGLARAVIAHLATLHAPHDLRIGVCTSSAMAPHWDWVKWLPHAHHPTEDDALGPVRLVRRSLTELEELLAGDLASRPPMTGQFGGYDMVHHVIVLDGGLAPPDSLVAAAGPYGVTLIDLGGVPLPPADPDYTLSLRVGAGGLRVESAHAVHEEHVWPDSLTIRQAEALARQLAPLRADLSIDSASHLSTQTAPAALFGLDDPRHIDLAQIWRDRGPRARLRVPIGLGGEGRPVELDFKEAALGGAGPHGLCVGATGSGKSELLRSLILGLALAHPPDRINFVLVDFKGGFTYSGLHDLPHVAAVATNLAGEEGRAKRTLEYLQGELRRRQELLRNAGNLANAYDYERARTTGAALEPLPALFLVIDEFSDLLAEHPDAIDVLLAIGRTGRSLGVHMLLASQRLEEGRLRGLDTYLSCRIGLRTFSAYESRITLGVPDAYELPAGPGHGYLKTGTNDPVRFRATYVSGPVDAGLPVPGDEFVRTVAPFVSDFVRPEIVEQPVTEPETSESVESFADVVVRQLAGHGQPAHPVLLPPLEVPSTLDMLLPPLRQSAQAGLGVVEESGMRGVLHALLGVEDRPYQQRQEPFWLDLSGSAGHAAVVGARGTGVGSLLHTLILSLSLLHTPQQVQFHCIDAEGSLRDALTGLPHLGTLATLHQTESVHGVVRKTTALLEQREREFAAAGIDSVVTFRRLRDRRLTTEDDARSADVFLVVHGWRDLQERHPDLVQDITRLAAVGLGFGIHVVITARNWSEIRSGLQDLLGGRVELALRDPLESLVDRRQAARLPRGAPGHGLTGEGLHFLAALARIDGDTDTRTLPDGTARAVSAVAEAWHGPVAAPVGTLPEPAPAGDRPTARRTGSAVPIGIDEDTRAPVSLDLTAEPHCLVYGDPGCGKSNLLRLIATGVGGRRTEKKVLVCCIGYRGSLAELTSTAVEFRHATTPDAALRLVRGLAEGRVGRGSETYLVMDDYDMIRTGAAVLEPLAELVADSAVSALHLIVAQRYTGAAPEGDPVRRAARQAASPWLLMSGDSWNGDPLPGTVRPRSLPVGAALLVARGRVRVVRTAPAPAQPVTCAERASRTGDGTT